MGFCIFSNVALAAAHSVNTIGLKRVLVVDWDVHHGNGTQEIFLDDPRVLVFSAHRYDRGIFYPGSYYQAIGKKEIPGAPSVVGNGDGAGHTINLGWDCVSTGQSMGNADYVAAWDSLLMPIAEEYDPELVIISAGFDSALGDPEGELGLTPEGYAYLTSRLMSLANGRVVMALEGGYNIPAVKYCLAGCTATLLGTPAPGKEEFGRPCETALAAIAEVAAAQRPYWKCLQ